MNIISKNFLSLFLTAIIFYLWGHTLSSNAAGGIIGNMKISYDDENPQNYIDWFYKFSVSSISASIVSGCLAERMHVSTYMMFTLLMSGAIYPISASWVLGDGWLNRIGYHDAAGAGYIHMIGGVSGLVGTLILGPRFGIYDT
jgi:ammonium transporter, Amt family